MSTRKTALVTGAGGFVGGHLVRRLVDEDYWVIAVDCKPFAHWWQRSENVTEMSTYVRNLGEGPVRQADEIYHLAADMGGIGYITHHLVDCSRNIVETLHLLDQTRIGQRIFFSSSACVYPQHLQDTTHPFVVGQGLAESDAVPADPEPGYGWEKMYAEHVLACHARERNLRVGIARYHNVYGPHGSWNDGREKAPAALCRKVAVAALTGSRHIDVWGDGEQVRSFMYVDDCVEGTLRVAREAWHRPVRGTVPLNLGSDRLVTVNQLIDVIERIAGVTMERSYDPAMPQGVRGRNSDNTLIEETLHWSPRTTLEDGLERTYAWVYDRVRETL